MEPDECDLFTRADERLCAVLLWAVIAFVAAFVLTAFFWMD